jgi:hypothetical protein
MRTHTSAVRIAAAPATVAAVAGGASRFLVAQSTDVKEDYGRAFAFRTRIDGTVHNLPNPPSWLSDGATALSSAAHAAYPPELYRSRR